MAIEQPRIEPLSQAEREDALEGLPDWDFDDSRDAITRTFTFADFSEAFAFMTRVALADLKPAPLGGELPLIDKETVRDLIPDMTATGGFVLDKVEGLAITPEGTAYIVTDNDGTDDSTGETMFFTVPLTSEAGDTQTAMQQGN